MYHRRPHSFPTKSSTYAITYENWSKPADHLGAYVLWKLNWIHPFADGNGRTARAVAYVVMSIKLDSLLLAVVKPASFNPNRPMLCRLVSKV